MPVAPKMQQIQLGREEINARTVIRRLAAKTNLPLLVVAALLVAYGLLVVYSVITDTLDYSFSRQLTGVGIGLVSMCLLWAFDYRKLSRLAFPLLVVTVILILLPLIPGLGVSSHGARNWILIFDQQIQPSEFAKPLIILYAAALIARYEGSLKSGREYLKMLALLLIPVICIIAQPDIGTGLVFFVMGMTILFVGGANRKWLIITGVVIIAGIVLLVAADGVLDRAFGRDVFIQEYQMNRILVFFDRDIDASAGGASYNLRQALIAIGSGGLFGKGFGNATQSSLGFLPEASTDFIFCVLAEQFGFVGTVVLLALYIILLIITFRIAFAAKSHFGTLIAAGIMGMWVFQIFVNIGMSCGVMPIIGIPLPFMSYGSSFMMVNFMALGLLCSIWARRDSKTTQMTMQMTTQLTTQLR